MTQSTTASSDGSYPSSVRTVSVRSSNLSPSGANDLSLGPCDVALDGRMTERVKNRSSVEEWVGEIASICPSGGVGGDGDHDHTSGNCG
jgi:hypothetical protein